MTWSYSECRKRIFLKRNPSGWTVSYPASAGNMWEWYREEHFDSVIRDSYGIYHINAYAKARTYAKQQAIKLHQALKEDAT